MILKGNSTACWGPSWRPRRLLIACRHKMHFAAPSQSIFLHSSGSFRIRDKKGEKRGGGGGGAQLSYDRRSVSKVTVPQTERDASFDTIYLLLSTFPVASGLTLLSGKLSKWQFLNRLFGIYVLPAEWCFSVKAMPLQPSIDLELS